MKTILLSVFIISGCGNVIADFQQKPKKDFDLVSEATLTPYLKRFGDYYKVKTSHIATEFTVLNNTDQHTVGLCWAYDDGARKIQIDTDYWNNITDNGKEQLIWHELGHCALNLGHDENLITRNNFVNIPESIMYPSTFGDTNFYADEKDYYFKELIK